MLLWTIISYLAISVKICEQISRVDKPGLVGAQHPYYQPSSTYLQASWTWRCIHSVYNVIMSILCMYTILTGTHLTRKLFNQHEHVVPDVCTKLDHSVATSTHGSNLSWSDGSLYVHVQYVYEYFCYYSISSCYLHLPALNTYLSSTSCTPRAKSNSQEMQTCLKRPTLAQCYMNSHRSHDGG